MFFLFFFFDLFGDFDLDLDLDLDFGLFIDCDFGGVIYIYTILNKLISNNIYSF